MGEESPKPASAPTGAVFLSYASQDAEAARKICEALRAAGIEVWLDQSELRGGDAWDRKIRDQIRHCTLFIPVISSHSQARLEGYFRREWKFAVERKRDIADELAFLLPVVIDETPERGAAVPEGFHEVQWTRLPGGAASQEFIQHVSRLLTGHPDLPKAAVQASQPTPAPAPARSAAESKAGTPLRMWLLLIAVATAVIVGYIGIDRYVLHRGSKLSAASATSANPDKSIAVLPFVDLSEKHDQEYFADGMAEEILNLLVKVPNLKVVGRTSSFQFKGKTGDLRQIGTVLGAAYVVEGSVRRSGDHLRVTAQLIDTRDGTHRWSETYDREASDTLKVQNEIATSLVRALQLEVASSGGIQGRVLPKNGEVYDTYLRGLHALNRFDQPGMSEAVAHFRRALTLDPLFVPAAEQLARTLCAQLAWGFVQPGIGSEQARMAARAALKLDTDSAIAHAVLGCVHDWYDWDWDGALQEVKAAMALDGSDPFVLVIAEENRIAIGQWAEALSLADTALSTDPLYPTVYANSTWAYVNLGRFAEAERAMRRVLEISPTFGGAHHDLGVILLIEGKTQEALAEMQKETPEGGRAAGLVLAYTALHRNQEAELELRQLEAEHAADMAMLIAEAYAFRAQKDQAFAWLNRAYSQKDILLSGFKGDPLLKNLQTDPRYKAFLRKMNLPE